MRLPRSVSWIMLALLLIAVSGSLGLSETAPGTILEDVLRQFGGALIGGAIAHHAYRHHHRYARPYHRKYAKSYRRHYRPHAYYAPAIVVPLPFVYVGPRW